MAFENGTLKSLRRKRWLMLLSFAAVAGSLFVAEKITNWQPRVGDDRKLFTWELPCCSIPKQMAEYIRIRSKLWFETACCLRTI